MMLRFTLMAGCLIAGTAIASAQTEYLDSSFNGTGRRTIAIGPSMDWAASVAQQRDAKLVVAGYSNDTKWRFALTRLLPNGTTDASFGSGGKVLTSFGANSADYANAVAVDTSGKIVAAGFTEELGEDVYAIAKYLPDGRPDSSFDADGLLTTKSFITGRVLGLAVQLDGTITVCGSALVGSADQFGLLRLKPTGVPDPSFGTGGKVITTLPGISSRANALAIQPDGKIIAVGATSTGSGWDFALVRYKIDGTPDPSFGFSGIVVTDMGTADDMATSVVLQQDGRIVVAGNVKNGGVDGYVVARYLPNGLLDVSFGTGGKVFAPTGLPASTASTVLLQSTGKIVVAGQIDSGSLTRFMLARFRPDGTPDSSFSGDGRIHTVIGTSHAYILGATLQVDDKPVVAGWAWNGTKNEFAVARYQPVTEQPVSGIRHYAGGLSAIRVYPNPAGEKITLSYQLDRPQQLTLQLTDAAGRVLQTYARQQLQPAGMQEQQLLLPAGLPSGVYYLRLSTPAASAGVKVLR